MFEVYINMLQHIEKDIQNKHFFMFFFFYSFTGLYGLFVI
jgi:hypothetical protein